ncbi:asparaginase-domain-containing protein [Radiomyces spectabilis]|uniref:asparaginase-domain-containing protein n=1 Tax=Radiomyces spectabilis TaxID=64574 RepID=UPI00221FB428|nr:asparaginase-domain-containing protein [Radiomyces spectabilis]KAI8372952.1 asparaginase-domain-containing protein [Radiomyces spectabilis]
MFPGLRPASPFSNNVQTTAANDIIYNNAAVGHQLSADRHDMLVPDVSRVLIIYTGGTIGMKNTPQHGYIPLPNYLAQSLSRVQRFHDPSNPHGFSNRSRSSSHDSLESLSSREQYIQECDRFGTVTNTVRAVNQEDPEKKDILTFHLPSLITPVSLYGKRIRYSVLEYEPLLDSSNMTMSDWVRIAADVEANYQLYDAFIVLHGTDTMAYTASALSFMLEELGKTVIITGSQVPLTEVRNDAVENLLGALTIAGHFVIPEVTLYFGKKLYRGNRTSKISAVDFEAFDSPNLAPLVDVGINIDVRWPLVLRPTQIAKFQAHKQLNTNVASLRLFPGINETTVRAFLAAPIQGVVLETYGAGNAPSRPDLLAAIKEACDRGVVIVNCTQCRKGLVNDAYATGKQLALIGVVAGADMTPECALTKLSYLLGKTPNDPDQVRRMMTKNLRGELTIRTAHQRFSASTNRTHSLVEIMMNFASRFKTAAKKELEGEAVPDLTMSMEEQLTAERALGPVLLCSAAGSNDLEGITQLFNNMGGLLNLNCVDYSGRVPLHVACKGGHVRIVEFLLLNGASIHVRDHTGHTPLFDAIVEKRSEIVDMLISAGAHLAETEMDDFGPLWLKAVKDGDMKMLKLSLKAGWDVNWSEPVEGRRAIDIGICEGRVSILKMLLFTDKVNLALKDRWGLTVNDKLQMIRKALETSGNMMFPRISQHTLQEMELLLQPRLDKMVE